MALSRRRMPSLAELIAFEAVARLGSFTKASEELALTQGALSKQIRQLEETLGVILFERTKRHVKITKNGAVYVTEVRSILWKLERSTSALIATQKKKNVLTCAVPASFAGNWLAGRLAKFVARNAGLTINLKSYIAPFDFADDPVDLAIHLGRSNWPGATATHLFDEIILPVTSPAHRDLLGIRKPADLSKTTLIHHTAHLALWGIWHERLNLAFDPTVAGHTFDHFTSIAQAAASGLGVALFPQFLIAGELSSGRLAPLFDLPLLDAMAYYLVVPHDKESDALVKAFSRWIVSEIGREGQHNADRQPAA